MKRECHVRFCESGGVRLPSATRLVVLIQAHPSKRWLLRAVPKRLRQELAKLQVQINEEKSRKVDLVRGESFGFLGFDFRRVRSLNGRWRPQYTPKLKKRRVSRILCDRSILPEGGMSCRSRTRL